MGQCQEVIGTRRCHRRHHIRDSSVPWALPRGPDDSQPPGRDLFVDPMVQHDGAIGDIFFQSVPG